MLIAASAACVARPSPDRLQQRVTVHQTVAVAQLSEGERQWQQSWRDLGFAPRTADDAQCRRDVEALVAQTGEHDYLQARAQ